MRFLTWMSLTRNPRSDLLPSIIKIFLFSWNYLVIPDNVSYPTPQLPKIQLGKQTHFTQLILWTVRHPNQLLLISPTSSPVRLGNHLGIVLAASRYLFSSIHTNIFIFNLNFKHWSSRPSWQIPQGRVHQTCWRTRLDHGIALHKMGTGPGCSGKEAYVLNWGSHTVTCAISLNVVKNTEFWNLLTFFRDNYGNEGTCLIIPKSVPQ